MSHTIADKKIQIQGEYTLNEFLAVAEQFIQSQVITGDRINNPDLARDLFRMRLAGQTREIVSFAFLNNKNQVIAIEDLFSGGMHGANIDFAMILRRAIHHNATGIVMAHNHPSGNSEPSGGDIIAHRELERNCQVLDIRLIDSIVIAGNEICSLREENLV